MPDEFQYDVFLSHSAKDKAVVRPLAERLRADGLRVWFDEWVLKPGDSIPAKIGEGLEHSRVLVLCMSANAFGSDWAQLEAGTFRFRDPLNKERRFIPLRLDDAPIKGSLAQFLFINWSPKGRDEEYAKLLQACRRGSVQHVNSATVEVGWRLPTPKEVVSDRSTRDGFNSKTKDTLARRVGMRCSNPACQNGTSGPHSKPDKSINIGVAAHIAAAAADGPRYDAAMSRAERSSISNGIWLCQNCAKLVDNDIARYTVACLQDWKKVAEQNALRGVETNLPPHAFAADTVRRPGGRKLEGRVFRRRIIGMSFLAGICIFGILAYTTHTIHPIAFSGDGLGILLLNIVGDKDGSLKRELLATLNNELAKGPSADKIKLRAVNERIDESIGRPEAHGKARQIGKKYNADVVLWGAASGEKKLFPRITMVNDMRKAGIIQEFCMDVQDISGLSLPPAIMSEAVSLAHFAAGYARYGCGKYQEALALFDSALIRSNLFKPLAPDFRFFGGLCHWYLCEGHPESTEHQRAAVDYLQEAVSRYAESGLTEHWARAQAALALVYLTLPDQDRTQNLKKGVAAYEAALRVFTEQNFPRAWAGIQQNLSVAHAGLFDGRPTDVPRAISTAESAARVFDRTGASNEWATVQLLLCKEYAMLPLGKDGSNLLKSITAAHSALRVFTERHSPNAWAEAQGRLCTAYRFLPIGDMVENARNSVSAGEAALRIFTEKESPKAWGGIQGCLCSAYRTLAADHETENLKKSLTAGEAALRVITESDSAELWTETQVHLGDAYQRLGILAPVEIERENYFVKSIGAFESALRSQARESIPGGLAVVQAALCSEYVSIRSGNLATNLQKAIAFGQGALRSITAKENRQEWLSVQNNLAGAYTKLPILTMDDIARSVLYSANILDSCSEEDYATPYYSNASNAVRLALSPEPAPPLQHPRIEVFSITDSNRMIAAQDGENTRVLFKLKAATFEPRLQAGLIQTTPARLVPLSHWSVMRNVAITTLSNASDLAGAMFVLRYECDGLETNLVRTLQIRGKVIFCDDTAVHFAGPDLEQ